MRRMQHIAAAVQAQGDVHAFESKIKHRIVRFAKAVQVFREPQSSRSHGKRHEVLGVELEGVLGYFATATPAGLGRGKKTCTGGRKQFLE